jgi:uncharacterized membrane protein
MRTLIAILLLACSLPALAGDPASPHPHLGIAPKFKNPERTQPTAAEAAKLAAGDSVRKQIQYDDGGRGISIMDIKGTPEEVWTVIMDFDSYPGWVDMLERTDVYSHDEVSRVKVFFALKVMAMDVEYWIDHRYDKAAGHMTWELDYSKHSDIDDSTGYWLVYPSPGRAGFTRVEYTVDLRLSGFVPKVVENLLANQGLDRATSWVKQQVED